MILKLFLSRNAKAVKKRRQRFGQQAIFAKTILVLHNMRDEGGELIEDVADLLDQVRPLTDQLMTTA